MLQTNDIKKSGVIELVFKQEGDFFRALNYKL